MYRVAVIQNESEMQRTGYANVCAKISKIDCFSEKYTFEPYTVVNILDLFNSGSNHLSNYDSLIITTNATSDKVVYQKLVDNKESIEQFIKDGKGIFISSQKKLSKESLVIEDEGTKREALTNFLPDKYDFYTVRRPKNDSPKDDSGIGEISFYDENEILLSYPEKINTETTNDKCENNAFQKHFYRSYIEPVETVSYRSVLMDKGDKYQSNFYRNLMMVSAFPTFGEKIVVSTIVLDWEYHDKLLTNIITYITEGLPQIAFIYKDENSNISCLIESAHILKKPYTEYSLVNKLNTIRKDIHNIYVFSNDYDETDIYDFLKNINKETGFTKKIVYWIKEDGDILNLVRCFTNSSIDKMIAHTIPWLESLYPLEKGMWNNSFWTTFEILSLYEKISSQLDFNIECYIEPIFKDIKTHYNLEKHSYDGVVSATCGLIQLICLLKENNHNQNVFLDSDFKGMIEWVTNEEKFKQQSVFDKRNVAITIGRVYKLDRTLISEAIYRNLLNEALKEGVGDKEYSEIEVCQIISICLLSQDREAKKIIKAQLDAIKKMQTSTGAWSMNNGNENIGRTAHVLIFLLENFDRLHEYMKDDLKGIIYKGILFLRSKYNGKNWGDEDIQATAKATHAIFLYNEKYHTSMYDYDIIKIIDDENYEITYSTIIGDLAENLKVYRDHHNRLKSENEMLRKESFKNKRIKNFNDYLITVSLVIIGVLIFCVLRTTLGSELWLSIVGGLLASGLIEVIRIVNNKIVNK